MFLTGFADEASRDLKEQIRATEELGWNFIETRSIGGKSLGTLSDAEFDEVLEILSGTRVRFNCYGSAVANWSRSPRSDADFEASRKELLTAVPRMHKLGIKMIRGMSFRRAADETFDNPDLEKVIFAKIKELVRICEGEGIIYGHENCMNYGGQSWHHTLRLLENINSDHFQLIFDTGNPTFNFSRLGPKPYKLQSSWEFYSNVREFVTYVHIKDANCEVMPDGSVVLEARTMISDVNEIMDTDIPDTEDADTIGGYICYELGRIPEEGEIFHFANNQLSALVLKADKRKILQLKLMYGGGDEATSA